MRCPIAHASSCFWVHPHKVVLAGYSSGGGLAYHLAMATTRDYAGVLIENSSLSSAVGGSGQGDAALAAAGCLTLVYRAEDRDAVNLGVPAVGYSIPMIASRPLGTMLNDTGTAATQYSRVSADAEGAANSVAAPAIRTVARRLTER